MYIKEIKINGFKSFADKTIISLDKSFTGIVGPNGSGKSNIVDAVKWVLGEQSIKSLRAESGMSDVIFSGSSSRKESNHASVAIVFDNSDKSLNIDFEEVEIKRVVYRSGENEYFINNEKCRLKDITNLLVDSMSSKESLNIIPQKKVDEILSEKSDDRRGIFEDAAGVLKYKNRKIEVLRKLDKTHDNMSRVDMIINEISENLLPLERDSIKAREYKETVSELENVEVALIVKDVTTFSEEVKIKSKRKEELENELSSLNTSTSSENANIEKIRSNIFKIDEEIKTISEKLIVLNKELVELSNKKTLMSERNKYDKNSEEVKNNIINVKDELETLKLNYNNLVLEIDNLSKEKDNYNTKLESSNNDLNKLTVIKSSLVDKYNKLNRLKLEYTSKIEILENNISNLSKVPYSVKSIIDNPTLRGIHNILGALIDTKDEYTLMLDVSLGASANTIIVEDNECAKEAIEYLKSHNKGRATFFPLNVIKPKSIDPSTLEIVKDINGFVDIAANLVNYNSKYYNIVMNQLGNIIVATDVNSAIYISKKINHSYRVVSLDGEILHVGGSLTGGSIKSSNSFISDKNELEKININLVNVKEEIAKLQKDIDSKESDIDTLKNNIFELNIKSSNINESINSKNILLEEFKNNIKLKSEEINNLSNNSETIDKELNEIIEKYYEKENIRTELSKKLELCNNSKLDLNKDLELLERSVRKTNNESSIIMHDISNLEVEIAKYNSVLDNLLNRLNDEYSITYEKACNTYSLEIEEELAREQVRTLRRKIKSLGEVNLGSIEEYERVSTRVNFLNKQKEDLIQSEKDLLSIIDEADNIMKEKFLTTFNDINLEFGKVFKTLFGGGNAYLKLTNPEDILNTGIDIIAVPSGKSLKPISLLSGGERTLTAISLLFAIMNLKSVPFVILDEVESDLDDNNVAVFCDYLKSYKNKTQLLIITHKKKTMEYLDTLYGITMQESGVSKLVSVKLEN